jgi:AtzH-like
VIRAAVIALPRHIVIRDTELGRARAGDVLPPYGIACHPFEPERPHRMVTCRYETVAEVAALGVITPYGRRFATASALFHRDRMPGKPGRQMRSWVRFGDGWHIVAAHISLIDA